MPSLPDSEIIAALAVPTNKPESLFIRNVPVVAVLVVARMKSVESKLSNN